MLPVVRSAAAAGQQRLPDLLRVHLACSTIPTSDLLLRSAPELRTGSSPSDDLLLLLLPLS